jgi:hypothetical protein
VGTARDHRCCSQSPHRQIILFDHITSVVLGNRKLLYAIPELEPWSGNSGSTINKKIIAMLKELELEVSGTKGERVAGCLAALNGKGGNK